VLVAVRALELAVARLAARRPRLSILAGEPPSSRLLVVAGVAAIVTLLIYEHSLVKADDLSRVNAAFFTMNGYVSVLFLVFWAADVFLFKPGV